LFRNQDLYVQLPACAYTFSLWIAGIEHYSRWRRLSAYIT